MKNVIFDLDGTLVHSLPGIEDSLRRAIQEVFRTTQVPDLARFIGPPIGRMIRGIFPSATEDEVKSVESAFRQHYDQSGYQLTIGHPGLTHILEYLAANEFELYILTNKPTKATRLILDFLNISRFFRGVVCVDSADGKRFENKMAAGEYCSRIFELKSEETCLIGDSADDMATARHCNWQFVAAAYGYGLKLDTDLETSYSSIGALKELEAFFATRKGMR